MNCSCGRHMGLAFGSNIPFCNVCDGSNGYIGRFKPGRKTIEQRMHSGRDTLINPLISPVTKHSKSKTKEIPDTGARKTQTPRKK